MTEEKANGERGFRVTGRVQGVGFRWWTRRTALELGLRGTVRNRPDGSVEVKARGPQQALDELGRRLQRGPGSARVREVQSIESEQPVPPTGFRILR